MSILYGDSVEMPAHNLYYRRLSQICTTVSIHEATIVALRDRQHDGNYLLPDVRSQPQLHLDKFSNNFSPYALAMLRFQAACDKGPDGAIFCTTVIIYLYRPGYQSQRPFVVNCLMTTWAPSPPSPCRR